MRELDNIPQSARRGVPLGDDNGELYDEIRRAAEANKEWDYTAEAVKLYRRAEIIVDRLYPVIHTPHFKGKLPPTPIAIESLRNKNTLAAYRIVPDGYGIDFKLTFNEQHYITRRTEEGERMKVWRYGEWAQMESLVHELGHHKQQLLGDDPFTQDSKVTHNKEFTDMMEGLGIYCNDRGAHYAPVRMDSPAGKLFTEWGLKPPDGIPTDKGMDFDWFKFFAKKRGVEKKGTSTLNKWVCSECGVPIRYGRKDNPMLIHATCTAEKGEMVFFIRPDEVQHQVMYEDEETNFKS